MTTKTTIETLTLLEQNLEGTTITQPLTQLQEREIVLLCHLITDPTNEEIGDKMCISPKSAENYKTRIGDKLCLKGHHALFRFVLKNRKFFKKLAAMTIKSQYTVEDSDDGKKKKGSLPAYYVFNYKEGGFAVISADDRTPEVLAYVKDGEGITPDMELPGGLLLWLKQQKNNMTEVRKLPYTRKNNGRVETIVETVGPLLSTTWNQNCGYNALAPITCINASICFRAYTGCVATSMAQVMHKWQKPTSYNWASMANNSGNNEVARLMRDAGNSVNMSYGCDGSDAHMNRIANALKNDYGYASATYRTYSGPTDMLSDIISNLSFGQPVILGGCDNQGQFLVWQWGQGSCHAWVCDGYQKDVVKNAYYNYQRDKWVDSYTYALHMNWGWGGRADGYYHQYSYGTRVDGLTSLTQPGNYVYGSEMILNIKP